MTSSHVHKKHSDKNPPKTKQAEKKQDGEINSRRVIVNRNSNTYDTNTNDNNIHNNTQEGDKEGDKEGGKEQVNPKDKKGQEARPG